MSKIGSLYDKTAIAVKTFLSGYGDMGGLVRQTVHAAARKKGQSEMLGMYNINPLLRRAVGKISYSVASTPWVVYRVNGKDGRPKKSFPIQKSGYSGRRRLINRAAQRGEVIEIEDHPMLDLLASPNKLMTGLDMFKMVQANLDITGEGFIFKNRAEFSKMVVELFPVPSTWVTRLPQEDSQIYKVRMGAHEMEIPIEDMIHFRDIDPSSPYGRGAGIGMSLGDEIEIDEYSSKMLKNWFYNSAKPETIIALEGAKKDQVARAKEAFEREHRGFWNAGRAFFTSGKLSIKELQASFKDQKLPELRKAQRDIVNTVFGIPPEILGIVENSNRATISAAETIYGKHVIVPRLDIIRAGLQQKLMPDFDERGVIDYIPPIPEDKEHKLNILKAMPYVATRGEIRLMTGLGDRGSVDDIHDYPMGIESERANAIDSRVSEQPKDDLEDE